MLQSKAACKVNSAGIALPHFAEHIDMFAVLDPSVNKPMHTRKAVGMEEWYPQVSAATLLYQLCLPLLSSAQNWQIEKEQGHRL